MQSTETLKRMVLIVGMLAALTAGSALTRPRLAVLAAELPGSYAVAPDVGYPNCMNCRGQNRASADRGNIEIATGRGRWSGDSENSMPGDVEDAESVEIEIDDDGDAVVPTGREPSS